MVWLFRMNFCGPPSTRVARYGFESESRRVFRSPLHNFPAQREGDKTGDENPDAVGDDYEEELLRERVAHAERGAAAHLGEAVEVEERLPEGHHRHREGQRDGVAAAAVVLQPE